MYELSNHWENATENIHGLVDSSWKRDKGTPKKKSWEGETIKILQNLTVGDRSLSGGIGNETVVLKGAAWISSQGLETRRATARWSVQLTQWNAEYHDDSMACCSVVLRLRTGRKLVNGVTYRCAYISPKKGTGSKGLMITSRENRSAKALTLYRQ